MNLYKKIHNFKSEPAFAAKSSLVSLAMAAMLAPAPASAQLVLEEIIVTAQKRDESINDVPISIQALGAEDIDRFGIDDVLDLRGTVPGLEIRRSLAIGNPTFTIRGVGTTNFDTITGAVVATYFDDIPLVSVGQLNFTTFDLQGIEVLKGPQGTLFGSGTTAGVVHFKTAKPSAERSGYIKTGFGDFGSASLEGAVGGSLGETLSGRISARAETFDGYYTNTATGQDAGGQEAVQVRGQLLWEKETSTVLVGAHVATSDGQAALYDVIPLLEDDGTGIARTCAPIQAGINRGGVTQNDIEIARTQCVDILSQSGFPGDDEYTGFNDNIFDRDIGVDLDTFGINVRADFELASGNTFTSITGANITEHGGIDPEGPGRPGATDVLWITDVTAFSQEFQLASGSATDNPWITGVSILVNEIENDLQSQLNFPSFGAEGSALISESDAASLAGSLFYSAPQTQDTVELGLYGQKDWKVNENLTAVTGARLSYYKKEGEVEAIGRAFGTGPEANFNFFPFTETELEEEGLSFNLGLNYTPNDDSLVYGKISQGIKSGSHAGGFIFAADSATGAEQETLLSYEVGYKGSLANGAVQLNTALFYYDYQDLQSLTQRLVGTTFVQQYTNIGDAEIYGADLSLAWAASEGLFFQLGVSAIDAEVTDSNADLAVDFTGNTLSTAPDLQASWLARYTFPETSGYTFSIQYDGNYIDDQFRNIDNNALSFDEATTKHNVVANLLSSDGKWEFSAFVKNISDEVDLTWEFAFGGGQRRSYLAPRTYGISAKYNFQ